MAISLVHISCTQKNTQETDLTEGGECELSIEDFIPDGGKYWQCTSGDETFSWLINVNVTNPVPCSGSYHHGDTWFMFSCEQIDCGPVTFKNISNDTSGASKAMPRPLIMKTLDEDVEHELTPPSDTIQMITLSKMSGSATEGMWSYHQAGDDGTYDVTCELQEIVGL
jgi:hypothetical protein